MRAIGLIASAALLSACLARPDRRRAQECIPGTSARCGCANGEEGAQICGSNGRYATCVCTGAVANPPSADAGPASCVPGASASCACTDGQSGAQVCESDGTFAVCVCTAEGGAAGFDAGAFLVSTLAGNGTPGYSDGDGGPNGSAEFHSPNGVAVASTGIVYVADYGNHRVRQIDLLGNVTTLAGGAQGFADGSGGADGSAQFNGPFGIAMAMDGSGSIYVADTGNNRIRKIDSNGVVTTVAGNGISGDIDGTGGPTGSAEFAAPCAVAVDTSGNLYVADRANNRIRLIDRDGNVTTFSGNGSLGSDDGTGGRDGSAQFAQPSGVAVDAAGNVYVADTANVRIRKLDPHGNATTLAGNGQNGYVDGTGGPVGSAEFGLVYSLAVDQHGNVYASDHDHNRVRLVNAAGDVTTLAGNGKQGFADGTGGPEGAAEFYGPTGIAVDAAGRIYVADNENSCIRLVTPVP